MSKNAKAIQRSLKNMVTKPQEEGLIQGQVFSDETEAHPTRDITSRDTGILTGSGESDSQEIAKQAEDSEDTEELGFLETVEISIPGGINVEHMPKSTEELASTLNREETVFVPVEGPMTMGPEMILSGAAGHGRSMVGELLAEEVTKQRDEVLPEMTPEEQEDFDEETEILEEGESDEALERKQLIAEIEQFVTICGYRQEHINRAAFMTLPELRDYVYTLRINSGGSTSVAQLLADMEEDFHKFINSEDVQRKLALAEAKGANFINVAQKVQRILGSDVVINSIRHDDYPQLVRRLVTHVSVVQNAITQMADLMRLEVPEHLDLGGETVPVVEGMQLNTKSTLYLLNLVVNNMRAWHVSSRNAEELRDRYQKDAELAAKQVEKHVKDNRDMQQRVESIRKQFEGLVSNVKGFVLKNSKGYLGKKDDEKPLSFGNLTYRDHLQDAIWMTSKVAASDLAQRIFDRKSIEFEVHPIIEM